MSAARPPEGANSAPPPASGLPDLGELTDLLKKAGIDTSALLQSLTAATAAVLKPSAPAAASACCSCARLARASTANQRRLGS